MLNQSKCVEKWIYSKSSIRKNHTNRYSNNSQFFCFAFPCRLLYDVIFSFASHCDFHQLLTRWISFNFEQSSKVKRQNTAMNNNCLMSKRLFCAVYNISKGFNKPLNFFVVEVVLNYEIFLKSYSTYTEFSCYKLTYLLTIIFLTKNLSTINFFNSFIFSRKLTGMNNSCLMSTD